MNMIDVLKEKTIKSLKTLKKSLKTQAAEGNKAVQNLQVEIISTRKTLT